MKNQIIICLAIIICCFTSSKAQEVAESKPKFERSSCQDTTIAEAIKSAIYFSTVIAKDSLDLHARYNLAMTYYRLSQIDKTNFNESIKQWDFIINKNPCYPGALSNRGLCKYFLKDIEGACKDFQQGGKCNYEYPEEELKKNIIEICGNKKKL
ncbi:MAG: hypothetical protein ACOYOA_06205 [Saprospiraceae bacterium]